MEVLSGAIIGAVVVTGYTVVVAISVVVGSGPGSSVVVDNKGSTVVVIGKPGSSVVVEKKDSSVVVLVVSAATVVNGSGVDAVGVVLVFLDVVVGTAVVVVAKS